MKDLASDEPHSKEVEALSGNSRFAKLRVTSLFMGWLVYVWTPHKPWCFRPEGADELCLGCPVQHLSHSNITPLHDGELAYSSDHQPVSLEGKAPR